MESGLVWPRERERRGQEGRRCLLFLSFRSGSKDEHASLSLVHNGVFLAGLSKIWAVGILWGLWFPLLLFMEGTVPLLRDAKIGVTSKTLVPLTPLSASQALLLVVQAVCAGTLTQPLALEQVTAHSMSG